MTELSCEQSQTEMFVCSICLETWRIRTEEDAGELDWFALSCGHRYCSACILHYLKQKIVAARVSCIECPDLNCAVQFTYKDVSNFIKADIALTDKFESFLLRNSLLMETETRFCPNAGCGFAVFAPSTCADCPLIQCQVIDCNTDFCYNCRETFQFSAENEAAVCVCTQLPDIVGTSLPVGVRRCPQCHGLCEKTEGCNAMTCLMCGAKFCWTCGKLFEGNASLFLHLSRPVGPGCRFFDDMDGQSLPGGIWAATLALFSMLLMGPIMVLLLGLLSPCAITIYVGFKIWATLRPRKHKQTCLVIYAGQCTLILVLILLELVLLFPGLLVVAFISWAFIWFILLPSELVLYIVRSMRRERHPGTPPVLSRAVSPGLAALPAAGESDPLTSLATNVPLPALTANSTAVEIETIGTSS